MILIDYKVTITPETASRILRDMGVRIDAVGIRLGIEQGTLPFGVFIQKEKKVFLIFKKKFTEWCQEYCGKIPEYENYSEDVC